MRWTRPVHLVQPNAASPSRVQVFTVLIGESVASSRRSESASKPGKSAGTPTATPRRDHRNCRQPLVAFATRIPISPNDNRLQQARVGRSPNGHACGVATQPSGRYRPSPQANPLSGGEHLTCVDSQRHRRWMNELLVGIRRHLAGVPLGCHDESRNSNERSAARLLRVRTFGNGHERRPPGSRENREPRTGEAGRGRPHRCPKSRRLGDGYQRSRGAGRARRWSRPTGKPTTTAE